MASRAPVVVVGFWGGGHCHWVGAARLRLWWCCHCRTVIPFLIVFSREKKDFKKIKKIPGLETHQMHFEPLKASPLSPLCRWCNINGLLIWASGWWVRRKKEEWGMVSWENLKSTTKLTLIMWYVEGRLQWLACHDRQRVNASTMTTMAVVGICFFLFYIYY